MKTIPKQKNNRRIQTSKIVSATKFKGDVREKMKFSQLIRGGLVTNNCNMPYPRNPPVCRTAWLFGDESGRQITQYRIAVWPVPYVPTTFIVTTHPVPETGEFLGHRIFQLLATKPPRINGQKFIFSRTSPLIYHNGS